MLKVEEVLNLPAGDLLRVWPGICDIRHFAEFLNEQRAADEDDRVPIRETIVYVILLYSKDSFLNKKPVEDLQTRIAKAAKLAGLDGENESIQKAIFYLGNDYVRELVVEYLISQNVPNWSNRCALDAQMAENLRIRFKPIQSEKANNDILNKHVLTEHYRDYANEIKKLDSEIFLGHENVRDEAVIRKRTTIESLVK